MRTYYIYVRLNGVTQSEHRVTSDWNMKAVLVSCFRQFFQRDPSMWWADKKCNMGQAWSRKRKGWRKGKEIEIEQVHREELIAWNLREEAYEHLEAVYALPLLMERRAL